MKNVKITTPDTSKIDPSLWAIIPDDFNDIGISEFFNVPDQKYVYGYLHSDDNYVIEDLIDDFHYSIFLHFMDTENDRYIIKYLTATESKILDYFGHNTLEEKVEIEYQQRVEEAENEFFGEDEDEDEDEEHRYCDEVSEDDIRDEFYDEHLEVMQNLLPNVLDMVAKGHNPQLFELNGFYVFDVADLDTQQPKISLVGIMDGDGNGYRWRRSV